MEQVKLVKGDGILSVQVWTEELPGRPFPEYAVLVDIYSDGSISSPKVPELMALRREILERL
jgi:hypothetical protein